MQQLRTALASANASAEAGSFARGNEDILVQAGTFLSRPEEVADLVVGSREGRPVFLRDVADVTLGPDLPQSRVAFGLGPQNALGLPAGTQHPAVTMGSYPSFSGGVMRCELVLRSIDAEALGKTDAALRQKLTDIGIQFE